MAVIYADEVIGGRNMFSLVNSGGINFSGIEFLKESAKNNIDSFSKVAKEKINKGIENLNNGSFIDSLKNIFINNNLDSSFSVVSIDFNDFKNISEINKRYMVLNPNVHSMIEDEVCVGFDGLYEDRDFEERNLEHKIDYNRIIDGSILDDLGTTLNYVDSFDYDDLTDLEKDVILTDWEIANSLMDEGIDVTDLDLGDL